MIDSSRLLRTIQAAARKSAADHTLIACQRSNQTTLRFSHQRMHQSFHSEGIDIWVKVICDGHVGVATTNSLELDALKKATGAAIQTARTGRRKRGHLLPDSDTPSPVKIKTFVAATVEEEIGNIIQKIGRSWKEAARLKYNLAGSFHRGSDELAVASDNGIASVQPFSTAGIKMIAVSGNSSGYSAATSRDIRHIDIAETAQRALTLAQANRHPQEIPLGTYDCILEPEAVAEILEWLGYIGFGAKSLYERTSFMAGRIGEKIMSDLVTLSDDPLHPEGLVVPFDYEGVPSRRVALIDRGIASGVVYDTNYGKIYHQPSTGHAAPYDDTEGPLPMHLTMGAGGTPRSSMERLLGNGLVITRFHYVNGLLDTRKALMTGLTRDGTFLVKKGKRVGSVKNLRFTESMLEAFSRVAEVSRERRLVADPTSGLQSYLAPAVLVRGLRFTGKTQ